MSHRPHRAGVVTLLVLLFGITYLDRVAISVAGPRMQQDLGIDPVAWGWVTGVFTLAYAVFEDFTPAASGPPASLAAPTQGASS